MAPCRFARGLKQSPNQFKKTANSNTAPGPAKGGVESELNFSVTNFQNDLVVSKVHFL